MKGAELLWRLADNVIAWCIVALALVCYWLLFHHLFARPDARWRESLSAWLRVLPVLLSALPLLGLLGTIDGLLRTFGQLSRAGVLDPQSLLSGGLADALLTTQLGLALVIPGWLLLRGLQGRYRRLASGPEAASP